MKILLTGYQGFIGKNYLDQVPNGWKVKLHEWGQPFPNVEGLDWVVHMGAISSTTEKNLDKIMEQNVLFSMKLFESCVAHNVNFQFSSSASVYGKEKNFVEDVAIPQPQNLYAMSKYLFEEYMIKRNPQNIKCQAFRYFNVFGPHEEHKGSQASPVHQFSKQAKEDGVIKVFEGSEFFCRDFVHVDKVVDVHKRMMKSNESGIWNVGTGNAVSFRDIADIIAKKHNVKVKTISFPEHLKDHYQEYTQANTEKLDNSLKKVSLIETRDSIIRLS